MPTPAIAGLSRGIEFVTRCGITNIHRHETQLAEFFKKSLLQDRRFTVYDPGDGGGTVLFNIKGIPSSEVGTYLDKKDIYVRTGFHCAPLAHKTLGTGPSGAVRVSFGVFNDISDASSGFLYCQIGVYRAVWNTARVDMNS